MKARRGGPLSEWPQDVSVRRMKAWGMLLTPSQRGQRGGLLKDLI